MKNLFERETVDEVISRIDTLRPTTPRQWGKMDVAQMLAHCSAAMDMASDRLKLPRRFMVGCSDPSSNLSSPMKSRALRMTPHPRNWCSQIHVFLFASRNNSA